ncbi:hypothetical protein [Nakamurella alba]|nr:hypothetical protein [Nakamurella alba]
MPQLDVSEAPTIATLRGEKKSRILPGETRDLVGITSVSVKAGSS